MNSDMFEEYHQEVCEKCGECLHECPVMSLPIEKAKAEMRNLIAGRKNSIVLKKCTSCMSCNFVCRKGCNPAMLILKRWHEAYENEGMPDRALWFTPHIRPNFRTYALEKMPEDEKALIKKWDDASPCEEIIYPGCNVITHQSLQTPVMLPLAVWPVRKVRRRSSSGRVGVAVRPRPSQGWWWKRVRTISRFFQNSLLISASELVQHNQELQHQHLLSKKPTNLDITGKCAGTDGEGKYGNCKTYHSWASSPSCQPWRAWQPCWRRVSEPQKRVCNR